MTYEASCGDTAFPPICGECREPLIRTKVGKGKRAQFIDTCACVKAPEPESATIAKRKVKNTAAKGGGEERRLCQLLREAGFDAYKTAGSGAAASRVNESAWDTDIICRAIGQDGEVFRAKVESKFYTTIPGLKSLVKMLSRSDWLWVRENNQKGYLLLPEDHAKTLLAYARQGMGK